MKKWYRLGGKASAFFDPQQVGEENQFLNSSECKLLESTPRVVAARKGDGLVELTEKEAQEFLSDQKKAEFAAESSADRKLASADKKLEEAKILKKESDNKSKQIAKLEEEADELKEENETLKSALGDPDQNPALKSSLEENAKLKAELIEVKKAAAEKATGPVDQKDAPKK